LGEIVPINPESPEPGIVEKAVRRIRAGGVIAFPTTCLYGLGADAFNVSAVSRIFELKARSRDNPLLLLVKDADALTELAANVPDSAVALMERFWPGALTIVFEAKPTVPAELTAGTGKIGVRIPAHPVALALVKAIGRPITGTSANLSGSGGCLQVSDLNIPLGDSISLILDAGPLKGGIGSTVIDVTIDPPEILREGSEAAEDLYRVMG